MGFNKEHYPKIQKDNDYFNDREKKLLNLDTSYEINAIEREVTIKKILNI